MLDEDEREYLEDVVNRSIMKYEYYMDRFCLLLSEKKITINQGLYEKN